MNAKGRAVPRVAVVVVTLFAATAAVRAEQGTVDCPMSPTPEQVGTVLADLAAGLYEAPPQAERGGVIQVGIAFHVVRRSNGTGGLTEDRLAAALVDTNEAFASANIRFCRPVPTRYIDSDEFYFFINSFSEIDRLRRTDPVPGLINIYCTEVLDSELGPLGGISSFTFSDVQGIVMRNSHVGVPTNRSTVPHEVGHYFNLFHTHESAFGADCASGLNCQFVGDQVCDTPADPRLGGFNVTGCVYSGTETDPCAQPYAPDPSNYMSYAPHVCRDAFTPGQIDRAYAVLLNLRTELSRTACGRPCQGDASGDLFVNIVDLAAVLTHWGREYSGPTGSGDADGDGNVNFDDILAVLANWNVACGP